MGNTEIHEYLSKLDFEAAGKLTLLDLLERRAQETPDAVAVRSPAGSIGFREWLDSARVISAAVKKSGSYRPRTPILVWVDTADARKVAAAWATYRGRTGRVESSWFLRRVRAGGVVLHAGRRWSGVGLQQHVGELVAVARMPDGALLAQTLELPAERLPLEALP